LKIAFGCCALFLVSCVEGHNVSKAATKNQRNNGNAVTHWNDVATEILPLDPGPILDLRGFAILHAAIHDAVNSVKRRYEPYTLDISVSQATIDVAVAVAAHDVLIQIAPNNRKKIEEAYEKFLAEIPDSVGKNDGMMVGHKSAQANLERRANDGILTVNEPAYVATHKPGDYDFTPPFNKPPLGPAAFFPGYGTLIPFVIDRSKYHVPGPYSLQSKEYALDMNYLKSIGKQVSSSRTKDQTEIAFFWFEGSAIWNQIANNIIRQKNLDAWESARIFALLNFAMADSMIVCFEAKYHFRFWRPYTAIRRAAEDENPGTEADEHWRPLLWSEPDSIPPTFFIPPVPEYPSAAATASAAAAEVLIQNFSDSVSFDAISPTLPNVTRHFVNFSEAAKECRLSRVYGGIHFQKAINDGFHLGKDVGEAVSKMLLRNPLTD
jgi:hypothetical protein